MKRILFTLALTILMAMPLAGVRAATLTPGTLIKASGPAVYYYSAQGTRLVFPNAKTYFTWYSDFSNVVTITDAELAAIQIGGNVTYRPGVKMVKVTTDPKVYAVDANGTLRWVTTEAIATSLYGSNWAKQVDDVPDAFFSDYNTGTSITSASSFVPSTVTSGNTSPDTTATPTTPTTPTTTVETSESRSVNIGDTFAIVLDSNPSTGYAWTWTTSSSTLVSLISDQNTSTSTLMGAGGTETFTFKGLAQGSSDIVFTYKRSWETTVAPAKRHTVHVTVNPAPVTVSHISLTAPTYVQPNQNVPILATATSVQSGDSITIAINGVSVATCGAISVCSVSYTVPNAGAAATTTILATLTHKDNATETATASLSLVAEEQVDSIILQIPRTVMRATSQLTATAYPGPNLNPANIYIVIDGSVQKDCGPNPTNCIYQGYLSGSLNSTHTIYARVKTAAGLYYRSKMLNITLATNDAPVVTVATGKANMFRTETVDVTATANDDDGVASITISQNGSAIKTCTGIATCTATAGPFPNLAIGDIVSFDATAIDTLGLSSATGLTSTIPQSATVTMVK